MIHVSYRDLERNEDGSWVCPHCQGSFTTSHAMYYRKHWAGRCQPPHQSTTEQDEDGWTGLAAAIAEEQRAAAAELQQAIMHTLSTEQQEQLRAMLADYAERVNVRVLAVSVELDNRGTQRAAAVLGRFKQEEGMDGVPSLLLGYSKLSELLHAPAAAADCAMYGGGQDMAADLWAEIEVGSSKQQC